MSSTAANLILRLEPAPLRAVRSITADGTVEYETAAAAADQPLKAFEERQRCIVKKLPAYTLLSPLDLLKEEEEERGAEEDSTTDVAATDMEVEDGTPEGTNAPGSAVSAAPPAYAAKHAEASARLAAARAEAACLVEMLSMLRQRQYLVPFQLMGLPVPPLQLEDDPALQLRRTQEQIGVAVSNLQRGVVGLRSRLKSERNFFSQVAALRSHWRILDINSRPSGAWERAYEVTISLGDLSNLGPSRAGGATSTAHSASASSRASSIGNDDDEEDETIMQSLHSGAAVARLRCDANGHLLPLHDASEAVIARTGIPCVRVPMPHHLQLIALESGSDTGHDDGDPASKVSDQTGIALPSRDRVGALDKKTGPLGTVHSSLLAALAMRRSRALLRHFNRVAGGRIGGTSDASAGIHSTSIKGSESGSAHMLSLDALGSSNLAAGRGSSMREDQGNYSSSFTGSALATSAGGTNSVALLGAESRRLLLGCAATPDHVLEVRLQHVPPLTLLHADSGPAAAASPGRASTKTRPPPPNTSHASDNASTGVQPTDTVECYHSPSATSGRSVPAELLHATPCLSAIDAALLGRVVRSSPNTPANTGMSHFMTALETSAESFGSVADPRLFEFIPKEATPFQLETSKSHHLEWLVGAASFNAVQHRLRESLHTVTRVWMEPILRCSWEFLPPGRASPTPPSVTSAVAGPAALVTLTVHLSDLWKKGTLGTKLAPEDTGSQCAMQLGVAVGACLCISSGPGGCCIELEAMGGISSRAHASDFGDIDVPSDGLPGAHIELASTTDLLRGLTGEVATAAVPGVIHSLLGRVLLSALRSRLLAFRLDVQLNLETNEMTVRPATSSHRSPGLLPSPSFATSSWVHIAVVPLPMTAGIGSAPPLQVRRSSDGGKPIWGRSLQQLEGVGQLNQLMLLIKRELRV